MEQKGSDQILVVTGIGERIEEGRVERGIGETLAKGAINTVSVSTLKKSMESFFRQLREILDTGRERIGAFEVDQVEVSAQITGDGKVCLMGSGVKIGVQGGVTFLLKRVNQ
jgi:hypothetical protein